MGVYSMNRHFCDFLDSRGLGVYSGMLLWPAPFFGFSGIFFTPSSTACLGNDGFNNTETLLCSPPKNTRADTHKIQKNLPRCRPISPGDDKSCAGKPLSFIRWRQSTRANCVRISWSKASQNGASRQDSKNWLGGAKIDPPGISKGPGR